MSGHNYDPRTVPRTVPQSAPGAIIFDWDNTLIDAWPAIHEALGATFLAYGLEPWTLEETISRVRKSLRDSFPGLFGELWEEAAEVFYNRYRAIHLEALKALPGAGEMLGELSRLGVYLAVVSNKNGEYLRKEARHLGWDGFFGQMVGATDAERDKPAPEPVEMALNGGNINKDDPVWFAGDALIDLECAVNSNCIPVLLRKNEPKTGEFDAFPPVLHFKECQALSNFVRKL
ncbi:MAG: HAD family hydrolase [Rhodospirillales bacterium]